MAKKKKEEGWSEHITSSLGRTRMTAILLPRFQDGKLTREEYKLIMDHEVEQGMTTYDHPDQRTAKAKK